MESRTKKKKKSVWVMEDGPQRSPSSWVKNEEWSATQTRSLIIMFSQ